VDVHIFRDSSATWCSYFPVVTKVLPLQRCTSTSLYFASGRFSAKYREMPVPVFRFCFASGRFSAKYREMPVPVFRF
jgi:hypothetical protein